MKKTVLQHRNIFSLPLSDYGGIQAKLFLAKLHGTEKHSVVFLIQLMTASSLQCFVFFTEFVTAGKIWTSEGLTLGSDCHRSRYVFCPAPVRNVYRSSTKLQTWSCSMGVVPKKFPAAEIFSHYRKGSVLALCQPHTNGNHFTAQYNAGGSVRNRANRL